MRLRTTKVPSGRYPSPRGGKVINFGLDAVNGKEVDFIQAGSCPDFARSVEIAGHTTMLPEGGNITEAGPGSCPVISDFDPIPNPCGWVMTDELDQQIRVTMIERSFCTEQLGWKNVTWPGPNGRVENCKVWNANEAVSRRGGLSMLVLFVLGSLGILMVL